MRLVDHWRVRQEQWRDGVTAWLSPWPVGVVRVAIVLAMLGLFAVAIERGEAARRWTWDYTESFRFASDIDRGYRYGRRALHEGYVDLYSRQYAATTALGKPNELNYAPMRLATMTWYAWMIHDAYPEQTRWQRKPYEFTQPVLRVNMAMELAASMGAFVLVVIWVRRAHSGGDLPVSTRWTWLREMVLPFRGWFTATIAAALVWFNPASWVNAHGWPLWDIWIVPFFLWALVCISLDRWLLAGVIIGIGAMFKGQQMLVAPLFVMVALFMGRPGAAGRWIAGLLLGLGAVLWPWMLTHRFEPQMVEGAQQATMRDPDAPFWNLAAIAWVGGVAAALLALTIISRVRRWRVGRAMPACLAGGTALALFACMPLFDTDLGWLRVGLLRGTEVFPTLFVANAYNIPALLVHQFGFHARNDLNREMFQIAGLPITLKQLTAAIYFVTLVLCAWGAARHWRRNDPRTLVALIAPWLLMFAIVTQMHERYLLFTAAMSAVLIAVRWPYVFMCLLLSFLAMCMTADTMLGAARGHLRGWPGAGEVDREQMQSLLNAVRVIFPGAAWAVVACCIVMLVDALGLGAVRRAPRQTMQDRLP
jgi:hypothetical protein